MSGVRGLLIMRCWQASHLKYRDDALGHRIYVTLLLLTQPETSLIIFQLSRELDWLRHTPRRPEISDGAKQEGVSHWTMLSGTAFVVFSKEMIVIFPKSSFTKLFYVKTFPSDL